MCRRAGRTLLSSVGVWVLPTLLLIAGGCGEGDDVLQGTTCRPPAQSGGSAGGGVKPANSYHPDIVVSGGDVVAATSGSKATSHKLAVASASLGDGKSADDSLPDCVVPPAAAANR